MANLEGCLASLVFAADLTTLRASIGDILTPLIQGFLDATTSALLTDVLDAVLAMFEPGLLHKLPHFLDTWVRGKVNEQVADVRMESQEPRGAVRSPVEPRLLC